MTEKDETKIKTHIIRFNWSDSTQKFKSIDKSLTNLNPDQKQKIASIVKKIEKKSGIKRDSCLLFLIIFTLATLVGFAFSFLLIISSKSQHGGVLIILTCLLVFFGFVGYQFHRGTQLTRVNAYLSKNGEKIQNQLSPLGFSIVHSFRYGKKKIEIF